MFNCKKLFTLQIRPPSLILLIIISQDIWIFPSESWEVRNSIIIINHNYVSSAVLTWHFFRSNKKLLTDSHNILNGSESYLYISRYCSKSQRCLFYQATFQQLKFLFVCIQWTSGGCGSEEVLALNTAARVENCQFKCSKFQCNL